MGSDGPKQIRDLLPRVVLHRWHLQPAGPAVLRSLREFRLAVSTGDVARVERVLAKIARRARAEVPQPVSGARRNRQHAATVSPTFTAAAPRSSLGLEIDRARLRS